MKKNRKILAIFIMIIAILASINVTVAFATERNTQIECIADLSLDQKNKIFTNHNNLINLDTMTDDDSKKIDQYEKYIEQRYNTGASCTFSEIEDEQIFRIVPEEVFVMLQNTGNEYSYVGLQYGYYVKNYAEENEYLVYIIDTSIEVLKGTGHISCKASPLYYEMYTYNENVDGKRIASVRYKTISNTTNGNGINFVTGFHKYSSEENLMLKDISFGGNLINNYHANINDSWYDEESRNNDNGMFFIGTDYRFMGRTLAPDNSWQGVAKLCYTALGIVPYLGDVLSIISYQVESANLYNDLTTSLTDKFGNGMDENTKIDSATDKLTQIAEYGKLIRNAAARLVTTDISPLLFGINDDQYATVKFYVSQTENWDTKFVGNMSFTIYDQKSYTSTASIESNFYELDINDGEEKFVLSNNEPQKVQISANKTKRYEYAAKNSGMHQFEIYCDHSGEHTANCIANLNIDGNKAIEYNENKTKAKVELTKGEKIAVDTALTDTGVSSNYMICGKSIPYDIKTGETLVLNFTDSEDYCEASFDSQTASAYNFSQTASGRARIGLYNIDRVNEPIYSVELSNIDNGNNSAAKKNFAEFLNKGKYIFKINNLEDTAGEVSLSPANAKDITLNYLNGSVNEDELFYKLSSQFDQRLSVELDDVKDNIEIYSNNGVKLSAYQNENIYGKQIIGGENYYIKLIKSSQRVSSINIFASYDRLNIGESIIDSVSNKKVLALCSNDSDFVVKLSCMTADAEIALIDKDDNIINLNENFELKTGAVYYVYLTYKGNKSYIVDLDIISTSKGENYIDNINGTIGENGYDVIKYQPQKSGEFVIDDSISNRYEIFNDQIGFLSGTIRFATGQTYYIKVYGVKSSNYNMNIYYASKTLDIGDFNVVNNGVYLFKVSNVGDYILRAFDSEFGIDVLGADDNILYGNLTISDVNKSINLGTGNYIFVLKQISRNDYLSIKSKSIIEDKNSLNLNRDSKNVVLNAKDSLTMKYCPTQTAEYYFEVGAEITDKALNVFYFDINNILHTLNNKINQKNSKIFQYDLQAGITYYFSLENYTDFTLENNYKFYIPTFIDSVIIDNTKIFKNGLLVKPDDNYNIALIMGMEYTLNIGYKWSSEYNSFRVSDKSEIKVIYGRVKIEVDNNIGRYETKIRNLILETTEGIVVLKIKIESPCFTSVRYGNNVLSIEIDYNQKINSSIFSNKQITATFSNHSKVLNINNFEFNNNIYSYNFKKDFDFTAAEYEIRVISSFQYNGNTLVFDQTADNKLLTKQINSGTVNGSRVYINLNNCANEATITVGDLVETLIITGTGNLRKLDILGNNTEIYLKMSNLNLTLNCPSSYGFENQRNNASLFIENNVNIKGLASSALLKGKNLIIYGNGSFNITGNNATGNLANGNGKNGVDGLNATSIVVEEGARVAIKIVAGNGSNGLTGKNGLNGANGNSGNAGTKGNIGGKGGDGGNGGQAIICDMNNKSSLSTVTLVFGNGGNAGKGGRGGNGGNGAKAISSNNPSSGGRGGDGGTGGAPGNVGKAGLIVKVINCTIKEGTNGAANIQGNGGDGGRGGDGANDTNASNRPSNGGNGGNGGSGYVMGNGGRGGDGGSAGDHYSGANGGRGGQGANGGDGGHGSGVRSKGSCGNGGDGGQALAYKGRGGRGGNGGDSGSWSAGLGGSGGNGGHAPYGYGGIGGRGGHTDRSFRRGGMGGHGGNGGISGGAAGYGGSSTSGRAGEKGTDGHII